MGSRRRWCVWRPFMIKITFITLVTAAVQLEQSLSMLKSRIHSFKVITSEIVVIIRRGFLDLHFKTIASIRNLFSMFEEYQEMRLTIVRGLRWLHCFQGWKFPPRVPPWSTFNNNIRFRTHPRKLGFVLAVSKALIALIFSNLCNFGTVWDTTKTPETNVYITWRSSDFVPCCLTYQSSGDLKWSDQYFWDCLYFVTHSARL